MIATAPRVSRFTGLTGPPARAQLLPMSAAAPEPDASIGPHHHEAAAAGANVDPAEVARFAALAGRWWDPDGEFRPLHQLAPARLTFIRDSLVETLSRQPRGLRVLDGIRLLDVGCGGGLVAEPLARLGATVTGIDLAEPSIEAARAHAAAAGLAIDYRVENLENLAAAGERFDAVLCLEVLEHVPDPAAFLRTAAATLEPGGVLIASTLNRTLKSYALAIVGAEHVLRWLPPGTHDWNRFLTPAELTAHLAAAGLTPGRVAGISYDPLTARWSVSDDTGVNYMIAATLPDRTPAAPGPDL